MEFFAEIENARELEKIIHSRLSMQRYNKEFFRCDLRTAVRVVKESIIESGYNILSHGGTGKLAFLTEVEKQEINAAAEEQKRKQTAALIERRRIEEYERQRKEKRDNQIALLEGKLNLLAPIVEQIIRTKTVYGSDSALKATARGALFFLSLVTIVGMPLADKIMPVVFDDGMRAAKRLSTSELNQVKEFAYVMCDLQKLNAFVNIVQAYCGKLGSKTMLFSTRSYGPRVPHISDWMIGVLYELGIPGPVRSIG